MKIEHSEDIRIIYSDITDIFSKIKKEHFLIGFFKNNRSFHTYFPNTENIFSEYSGKIFMKDLIKEVLTQEKKTEHTWRKKR
jgi:hypothetical protein